MLPLPLPRVSISLGLPILISVEATGPFGSSAEGASQLQIITHAKG